MLEKIENIDLQVVITLNDFFARHNTIFNRIFAEYLVYLLPIFLLVLWFLPARSAEGSADAGEGKKTKKVALRIFFSIILAWPLISGIIGKLIYRHRPFEFGGVQEILFHRPTYSFPSDHAAALFAVTFSLFFSGYKKLGYIVLGVSLLITFFRVVTGIHFPTDILAGVAIGALSAWIIQLLDKYLDKVYELIIKIFRMLHLG